eukprot:m.308902 g.308902  ORF g.308902 m.308902 type:complete len:52 (+) comp45014_c0_seq1:1302-1457(+)
MKKEESLLWEEDLREKRGEIFNQRGTHVYGTVHVFYTVYGLHHFIIEMYTT